MVLVLNIDGPRAETKVRPGYVLEARVGTPATRINGRLIETNPTNVFGYIRGVVTSPNRYFEIRTVLVERILPGKGTLSQRVGNLKDWAKDNWGKSDHPIPRVVGDLDLDGGYTDGYSTLTGEGSVVLSPERIVELQKELNEWVQIRGQQEDLYVWVQKGDKTSSR